jgi:hypothetical protein
MLDLPERYRWEATRADGSTFAAGESLEEAVMVSLLPVESLLLPRHDLMGLPFKRRFGRGFIRALGGGQVFEYVHCIVTRDFRVYIRSTNGTILVTPPDYELYL